MKKFVIKVNNQSYEVEVEEIKSTPSVSANNKVAAAPKQPVAEKPAAKSNGSGVEVTAPMPGNILNVSVKSGELVKRGQVLLVLEAMKMENEITAPHDGTINAVKVEKGQRVNVGELLVTLN